MNMSDTSPPPQSTSGGMSMGSAAHGVMANCQGMPVPERQGNWQGHVFPGSIFLIWATHWMLAAFWRHVVATHSGKPFRVQSTEALFPFIPKLKAFNKRFPMESILKAIGGFLLFFLQVYYGGYKYLVCDDGARDGRLATQHLNSWAHASMNLGFMLSGIIELLGRGTNPEGVEQAFLSLGFFIEAMLFSMHEKNGALDQTIHYLLAHACWAGAAFTALEAAWPTSFLLTCGRIGSMLLQGTWFIQSAVVLFEGHLYWDDNWDGKEDEAPAMFLPMVFAYHMLVVTAFMYVTYLGVWALANRRLAAGHAVAGQLGEGSRLLDSDDEKQDSDQQRSIALASISHSARARC